MSTIWQPHRPRRHPICELQEHIRRASEALVICTDCDALREDAMIILKGVLKQIWTLFQQMRNPKNLKNWRGSGIKFFIGPPDMNSQYYFYGLLDCTVQIAAFVDLEACRPKLYHRLKTIAFESEVVKFRLKAVSSLSVTDRGLFLILIILDRSHSFVSSHSGRSMQELGSKHQQHFEYRY